MSVGQAEFARIEELMLKLNQQVQRISRRQAQYEQALVEVAERIDALALARSASGPARQAAEEKRG